jgi:regulator of replication initiation timing
MSSNLERKKEIKKKIAGLSELLMPLLAKVEDLKTQIGSLESALAAVLDEQHQR